MLDHDIKVCNHWRCALVAAKNAEIGGEIESLRELGFHFSADTVEFLINSGCQEYFDNSKQLSLDI